MAFKSAATLSGATVAAIFIVVILMSSMGKMAAAEGTSCTQSSCISDCPSKAEESCSGLKHGGAPQCPSNCLMGCKRSCEYACNSGLKCPSGGVQACDTECRPQCDKDCYDKENPAYRPCLSLASDRCKEECEAACKGGN